MAEKSLVSAFTKTYSTFSGVDITALFDNMMIMTMQGIAISITREKVPVYVFGRSRPVSISRGKRGIAGTLQFVLFDRDALNSLMEDNDHQYYAHADEVNWLTNTFNPANYQLDALTASTGTGSGIGAAGQIGADGTLASGNPNGWASYKGTSTNKTGTDGGSAVGRSIRSKAQYMDQVWPFDITLMAQNEYGLGAWSSVIGVEIINEGGGISMDDLTNEEQATYIAIHRVPWTSLEGVDRRAGASDYYAGNPTMDSSKTSGISNDSGILAK